jgi:hypothetical protein
VVKVEMANHPPVEVRVVFGAGEKNRTIVVTMTDAPAPPKAATTAAGGGGPSNGLGGGGGGEPNGASREGISSASHGLPAASYVFGAIGIAALGSYAYFGLRGMLDADHLRTTCVPGCNHSDVVAVHTKLVVADVSLGVGIVSLAAATWFALQHRPPANHAAGAPGAASAAGAPSWELHAMPRAGGASAHIVVRF